MKKGTSTGTLTKASAGLAMVPHTCLAGIPIYLGCAKNVWAGESLFSVDETTRGVQRWRCPHSVDSESNQVRRK